MAGCSSETDKLRKQSCLNVLSCRGLLTNAAVLPGPPHCCTCLANPVGE